MQVYNTALLGTGAAGYYTDASNAQLENVGSVGWPVLVVYVDGIRCLAQEARFGGIVIQPESPTGGGAGR